MPLLGVNIDHVATIRQARQTNEPDPIHAAVLAEIGGADSITVHLREDRRHIQDRDVRLLREISRVRLNLEMAVSDEITKIAMNLLPDQVTLVPERREEVTTEGGLDVKTHLVRIRQCVDQLQGAGIATSAPQAMEILNSQEIHVIISDQRMPKTTGSEFFSIIKTSHPNPTRILLTGFTDSASIINAINEGEVFRFLTKPWDDFQLKNAIKNAYDVYITKKELSDKILELEKINQELNRYLN